MKLGLEELSGHPEMVESDNSHNVWFGKNQMKLKIKIDGLPYIF